MLSTSALVYRLAQRGTDMRACVCISESSHSNRHEAHGVCVLKRSQTFMCKRSHAHAHTWDCCRQVPKAARGPAEHCALKGTDRSRRRERQAQGTTRGRRSYHASQVHSRGGTRSRPIPWAEALTRLCCAQRHQEPQGSDATITQREREGRNTCTDVSHLLTQTVKP